MKQTLLIVLPVGNSGRTLPEERRRSCTIRVLALLLSADFRLFRDKEGYPVQPVGRAAVPGSSGDSCSVEPSVILQHGDSLFVVRLCRPYVVNHGLLSLVYYLYPRPQPRSGGGAHSLGGETDPQRGRVHTATSRAPVSQQPRAQGGRVGLR